MDLHDIIFGSQDDDTEKDSFQNKKKEEEEELHDFYFSPNTHPLKEEEEDDKWNGGSQKTAKDEKFDFETNALERDGRMFGVETNKSKQYNNDNKQGRGLKRKVLLLKQRQNNWEREAKKRRIMQQKYKFENEIDYGNSIQQYVPVLQSFATPMKEDKKNDDNNFLERETFLQRGFTSPQIQDLKYHNIYIPSSTQTKVRIMEPVSLVEEDGTTNLNNTKKNTKKKLHSSGKSPRITHFFRTILHQKWNVGPLEKSCDDDDVRRCRLPSVSPKLELDSISSRKHHHNTLSTYYVPKSTLPFSTSSPIPEDLCHSFEHATGTVMNLATENTTFKSVPSTVLHVWYMQRLLSRHIIGNTTTSSNDNSLLHTLLSTMYKKDSRFNWIRYFFCVCREMAVNYFFYHSFLHQPLQAMPSDFIGFKEQIHSLLLSPSSIHHDNHYHIKFDKDQNVVLHMKNMRLQILTKIRNYYRQVSKHTTKEQKQSILNDIIIRSDDPKDEEDHIYYMHLFFSTKSLKEWKDLLPPIVSKDANDKEKLEEEDNTLLNELTKKYSSKSNKRRKKQQLTTKEDYMKLKQGKREEERKVDEVKYQKEYCQFKEDKKEKKRIKMQGQIHLPDAMSFLASKMVSAIDCYRDGIIPKSVDRYSVVSHETIFDLTVIQITFAELLKRLGQLRSDIIIKKEKEEEKQNNLDSNHSTDENDKDDSKSFTSSSSCSSKRNQNGQDGDNEMNKITTSSTNQDLFQKIKSFQNLIMEFLDQNVNQVIGQLDNVTPFRPESIRTISAPLAFMIALQQSYVANSGTLTTKINETEDNDFGDETLFNDGSNFTRIAKQLDSFDNVKLSKKSLIVFPEIHLPIGIAKIASVLPSKLAEIISRSTYYIPHDPISRTPFESIRVILEQLKNNNQLIILKDNETDNDEDDVNYRKGTVTLSSLFKAMKNAAETFEYCSNLARVGEDGILYHSWHLATVLGLMCLASEHYHHNMSIRDPVPNTFKKEEEESSIGEIKMEQNEEIILEYNFFRDKSSSLFQKFLHLRNAMETTPTFYVGNIDCFHLSVMSLLEWKEAISHLIIQKSPDGPASKMIRRVHAYHTIQWGIMSDCCSDLSLQRLLDLWKSGDVSYDIILHLLACRLEKNSASKMNWQLLACAIIPLRSSKVLLKTQDEKKQFIWDKCRKTWWEQHFFSSFENKKHDNDNDGDDHMYKNHIQAFCHILEDSGSSNPTDFEPQNYVNGGVDLCCKNVSIDTDKLYCEKKSKDANSIDPDELEDREDTSIYHEFLPVHIADCNQLTISHSDILIELGVASEQIPLSYNAAPYDVICYKILIATYIYGNKHEYVESAVQFLFSKMMEYYGWEDNDSNPIVTCLKWLSRSQINISSILLSSISKEEKHKEDKESSFLVEDYEFVPFE